MGSQLVYTVVDGGNSEQTYEGFSPLVGPVVPNAERLHLVVAYYEGEYDLWYIDSNCRELAISELTRYYRSDGFVVVFQIWSTPDSLIQGVV